MLFAGQSNSIPFGLDEAWTRHHIIPLFSDLKRHTFAQAWEGFLMWGVYIQPLLMLCCQLSLLRCQDLMPT